MDDSLSGTTAVAVYMEGKDMWVANVGDSRAVLVQEHEGTLLARPLSSDQTPYRKVSFFIFFQFRCDFSISAPDLLVNFLFENR